MELRSYQKKVIDEFKPHTRILISFNTGMGKTITALKAAFELKKNIIIVSPSSIQPSYQKEINRWNLNTDGIEIKYVSINSGGYVYNQWSKAKMELNVASNGYNVCVICDELHIFSSMLAKLFKAQQREIYGKYISSSFQYNELLPEKEKIDGIQFSKNKNNYNELTLFAKGIGESPLLHVYEDIMNMSQLSFIGLSATPVVNELFELVPLINLCIGPEKISPKYYKIPLFTNYVQFLSTPKEEILEYIKKIKIYTSPSKTDGESGSIPSIYEKKIILKMSEYQFNVYKSAQIIEKLNKMDQLKILTRLIANFAPPERLNSDKIYLEKYENKIVNTDFDEIKLRNNSVKFSWILKFIKDHPNQNIAIYSEFIGIEGVEYLKRMLDFHNIKNISITSKISREYASELISTYNQNDNWNGSKYQVIVFSSVANQGVTLKNVQHMIILESPFNEMMTRQIIGRVARLGSHDELKRQGIDSKITIYRLFANENSDQINENMPDYYIYNKAKKRDVEIQEILSIMGINAS
jgi:hypothetical protein